LIEATSKQDDKKAPRYFGAFYFYEIGISFEDFVWVSDLGSVSSRMPL
jgi:hypothetical protein